MADQTRRYRATSRVAYARLIIAVVQYARDNPEPDFSFGPLSVTALESQGFVLSGPDTGPVSEVIARVPGVVEVPA